jgi:hypothetical protein
MWSFDIRPDGFLHALKYQTSQEVVSDPIPVLLPFENGVLMTAQQDHRLIVDSRVFTLPVPVPVSFGARPRESTPMLVDGPVIFKYNQQTSTTDLSFYSRPRRVVMLTSTSLAPSPAERCDRGTNVEMDEISDVLTLTAQRLKDLSDADCSFCLSPSDASCSRAGQ